jgi:hypothetical protein
MDDIIKKYTQQSLIDHKWLLSSMQQKTELLQEFANSVAERYLAHHAPGVEYEPLALSIDMDFLSDCGGRCHGGYNIDLNCMKLFSRNQAMVVAAHEATHHAQYLMVVAERDKIPKDQMLLRDAMLASKTWAHTVMFGIENKSVGYVDPNQTTLEPYQQLRESFYYLCAVEREARFAEIAVSKALNIEQTNAEKDLQHSLNVLKKRYNCSEFSDQQMYDLVDNAMINVMAGRVPQNAREASITYDYAVVLYGQKSTKQYLQSIQMLTDKEKAFAMSEAGFENAHVMSKQKIAMLSLSHILSMSKIELEQNPMVIAHGICKYGVEKMMQSECIRQQIAPHTIGETSFDRWYFSEDNQLSTQELDFIGAVVDQAYSSEGLKNILASGGICQIKNQDVDIEQLFVSDPNLTIRPNWDEPCPELGNYELELG